MHSFHFVWQYLSFILKSCIALFWCLSLHYSFCTGCLSRTYTNTQRTYLQQQAHLLTSCDSFDLIYDLNYVVGIANLSFNLISTLRSWTDRREMCTAMNASMPTQSMYFTACETASQEGMGLWKLSCDWTSVLIFSILMAMMMELWLFEVRIPVACCNDRDPYHISCLRSSRTSTPSRVETTFSIACCSCSN